MKNMFGRIGIPELLLILVAVLLIFGPKRLPEIGRSIGKGLREFRGASKDFQRSLDGTDEEEEESKEQKEGDQEKRDE